MASYDDFDGVYFTVQSIRLHHPEVLDDVSFVVIDNSPSGGAGEALRGLADMIPRYTYVPFTGFRGTAVRDLIFAESDAEIVCCVDSHVLLAPGALAALRDWYAAHPDSRDLLQGPLLWDGLCQGATHMDPEWREGMFGTWAAAPLASGPHAAGEPFEIGLHGLGMFACRRDAWPGINPRMRGFGGEEGYLHEKVRRKGGRVLCHPRLAWLHRFGRPGGVRYDNRWEDRIRNYIIGFSELGWDLDPARAHFRALLGAHADAVWEHARALVEHPLGVFDAVFCVEGDAAGCGAHGHPAAVAWRIERVTPSATGDRDVRMAHAWHAALTAAARRGYGDVLLLAGGGAVAIKREARAQVIDELGAEIDGCRAFLARWGGFDSYIRDRLADDGDLRARLSSSLAWDDAARVSAAERFDVVEHLDGMTIHRPGRDEVFELNRTAALVLRMCDGTRTVDEIATALADRFTLARPPVGEVVACVEQLRSAGIVLTSGINSA